MFGRLKKERMKANPGTSEPSIVKLMPQIPIGTDPSAGWFGGTAALPKDMAWPEQDGEKLLFVGQINLAALPRDLWSGLGPRQGWLGIFLPKKWPPKPTLLHFNGPLVEVTPPLPNDADWTRIFNFEDLISSPAFIVMKAASEFRDKTTAINQMWQTDFTYFKIIGWGWMYLSTILDDFSRYIISWKLCTTMKTSDVTETLNMALEASGCDQAHVVHKPRLLPPCSLG